MKKLITSALIFFLFLNHVYPQQTEGPFNIKDYKPPFLTGIYYKNFLFSASDIKWKPKGGFSVVDLTVFSNPKKLYQLDLLTYNHTYFKVGIATAILNSGPFLLSYAAPFGLRLPLMNGRLTTISLNSNFYLFPINTGYNLWFDVNSNPIIDGNRDDHPGRNWIMPRFFDNQLRFETRILGLSAIAGYRYQLSPWQSVVSRSNVIVYSGNLSGFYVGLSIGLKFSKTQNPGLKLWTQAKMDGTASGFERFISKCPRTPYTTTTVLTRIACEDSDPAMRLAAVNKINIQNVLIKVALNDQDSKVRFAAVGKISDQTALADIAFKDVDPSIRLCAANRIDNPDMLAKLALDSKDQKIRSHAISKLNDQTILSKVVLFDENSTNRLAALNIIDNQDVLSDIAASSIEEAVLSALVVKLNDQNALNKIARSNAGLAIRMEAFKRITDQTLLSKFASEEGDSQMRLSAIKKVENQVFLLKLALEDKEEWVRNAAFEAITDQSVLVKIVQSNMEWERRSSAFNRLNDSSLQEIGGLVKDPAVALAAQIRLGQTTWKEVFSNQPLSDLIGAIAMVKTPLPTSGDIVLLCHNYIEKGDASRIPELKDLLNRFGDVSLAEDYMNCGNSSLESAGQKWGRDHGYNVQTGPGSSRVRWGDKR